MNRLDIRDECESRMSDADNAIATDVQINRWINQAIRHIGTSYNWPFMRKRANVSLLLSTPTASLPADCRSVYKVVLTGVPGTVPASLFRVTDEWLGSNVLSTATGQPQYFTDGGFSQANAQTEPVRLLRVAPTPNAAFTAQTHYYIIPAELTGDSDVPPFPQDFNEAVILWVMRNYQRQLDNPQAIVEIDRSYKEEIERLVRAYGAWVSRYPLSVPQPPVVV